MSSTEPTYDWSEILKDLSRSLEARLERDTITTEDTVRYYFFLRLVDAGIQPDAMILERPHPHSRLQQKQIDLSVAWRGGTWDFEVKYHRPIPSGRNRPSTQLRGQVVSDFYKLALSDGKQRYMLYLADPRMAAHWEQHMEMLATSSKTSPARLSWEWFSEQPKTLQETVKMGLGFLPEDFSLRVWIRASCTRSLLQAWLFQIDAESIRASR